MTSSVAPSADTEATYVACGCGCCAGASGNLPVECYYPELGETIEAIVASDEAAAASPDCAMAGCSLGRRFVPCETPLADPVAATYEVSTYIGGLDHINVKRTSADGRCTWLAMSAPTVADEPFALDIPEDWSVNVTDYACEDESSAAADSRRTWIGAFGFIRFLKDGECKLDIQATLFFQDPDGNVGAVVFDGEPSAVQNVYAAACQ